MTIYRIGSDGSATSSEIMKRFKLLRAERGLIDAPRWNIEGVVGNTTVA